MIIANGQTGRRELFWVYGFEADMALGVYGSIVVWDTPGISDDRTRWKTHFPGAYVYFEHLVSGKHTF